MLFHLAVKLHEPHYFRFPHFFRKKLPFHLQGLGIGPKKDKQNFRVKSGVTDGPHTVVLLKVFSFSYKLVLSIAKLLSLR